MVVGRRVRADRGWCIADLVQRAATRPCTEPLAVVVAPEFTPTGQQTRLVAARTRSHAGEPVAALVVSVARGVVEGSGLALVSVAGLIRRIVGPGRLGGPRQTGPRLSVVAADARASSFLEVFDQAACFGSVGLAGRVGDAATDLNSIRSGIDIALARGGADLPGISGYALEDRLRIAALIRVLALLVDVFLAESTGDDEPEGVESQLVSNTHDPWVWSVHGRDTATPAVSVAFEAARGATLSSVSACP